MQENIDQKPLITKAGLFPWYLSLAFFSLVTLCSAFFGFMIWNTDNSIEVLSSEIATIDANTSKTASDRKIVVADILKNNAIRPSLNLGPILREFRAIAARSNVRLKGFSIVKDTINTTLIATEGDPGVHPDPAATVIKMMREYAENKMSFSLEPIVSLSGDPTMRTTSVEFHVLPSFNK